MKKLAKPLALSTETVRTLSTAQLAHVAGGVGTPIIASKAESCVVQKA